MKIVPQDIPSGSVLGINYGGLHDSSIALVAPDGSPIFAMSLERLTRHKQDGRPPYALLEQIPWNRISRVALSNRLMLDPDHQTVSPLFSAHLPGALKCREFKHHSTYTEFISDIPCDVVEVCHHLAHTASAFWGSGFKEALCLTYDGGVYSNPWFGGIYEATRRSGIVARDMFNRFHHPEVAGLYSFVTALLGFTPNRHEGKITGLAAYGKPTNACRELVAGWYEQNIPIVSRATHWVFSNDASHSPIGFVDDARIAPFREAAFRFSREEIAATLQEFCENHVVCLLKKARDLGWWNERICLAGGLFANVKINQRVVEMGFEDVFIAPPMTDDGTALGAAWQVLAEQRGGFSPPPLSSVYLGPSFPPDSILERLTEEGIRFQVLDAPAEKLATLLADGAVVAVYQDAMELGPRALGNRSILAQAINPDINQSLNKRLNRTEFMPFAPISRIEDAEDCFIGIQRIRHAAAFMTITADCTETMREACPAVVHIDGTARPQIVSVESNPLIHAVLTFYKNYTGRPALVNTSFNIHEEPIVCTPQDALKGFFESGLDYLFLGNNILVNFKENHDIALRYLQRRLVQPSEKAETLRAILHWESTESLARESKLEGQINGLQAELKILESQIADLQAHIRVFESSRIGRLLRVLGGWIRRVRHVFNFVTARD